MDDDDGGGGDGDGAGEDDEELPDYLKKGKMRGAEAVTHALSLDERSEKSAKDATLWEKLQVGCCLMGWVRSIVGSVSGLRCSHLGPNLKQHRPRSNFFPCANTHQHLKTPTITTVRFALNDIQAKITKLNHIEEEQARILRKEGGEEGLSEGQRRQTERNDQRIQSLTEEVGCAFEDYDDDDDNNDDNDDDDDDDDDDAMLCRDGGRKRSSARGARVSRVRLG